MSLRIVDLPAEQLRRLNSATQYPSIFTYHVLGERGRLTADRSVDFSGVDAAEVMVTEKIDGTNARIIIPPTSAGAPLIGSRTELLHYLHDVIANPAQGIVEAIKPVAERIGAELADADCVVVVFGEVYGGRTSSGSKNYSAAGAVGFRVFDVARIPLDVLDRDVSQIAAWRGAGGQEFVGAGALAGMATRLELPRVPAIAMGAPPVDVAGTHEWLRTAITATNAALDDTAQLRPEGVVVRTADRSRIAKIRFEDYERTAKATRGG